MNCPSDQLLSAYYDGEASPQDVAQIQAHLESCASCSDVIRAMRATSGIVRRAELLPVTQAMLNRWSSVNRTAQERSIRRLTASLTGIAASVLIAASLLKQPVAEFTAPAFGEYEQLALAGEEESTDPSSSHFAAKWMAADLAMRSQGGEQP
jgi:anti-sigma factor RsiW